MEAVFVHLVLLFIFQMWLLTKLGLLVLFYRRKLSMKVMMSN